jgi:hypothetical protein
MGSMVGFSALIKTTPPKETISKVIPLLQKYAIRARSARKDNRMKVNYQ